MNSCFYRSLQNMRTSIFLCVIFMFFLNCSNNDDENSTPQNPNIDNIAFSSANQATDSEGNTYEVGFTHVSNINQDPFVIKKDSNGNMLWNITHEQSEVDGRATMILIDSNDIPWVIFSVVGGSNNNTYITTHQVENEAFSNVYQRNYGIGGVLKCQ